MAKPRTKAPKGEQLSDQLTGELAVYEQVGLPQHALGEKTAYRYRGVLLLYQQALNGRKPSVAFSKQYLGQLRKKGFSEGSIYVHRAAIQGFHKMNTLAVLMVPIHGKRFKFFRRHIAPSSSLVTHFGTINPSNKTKICGRGYHVRGCMSIHPSHGRGANDGRNTGTT